MPSRRWLSVTVPIVCLTAFAIWLVIQLSEGDLDRGDKLASIVSMSVTIITLPLSVLAIVVTLRQSQPTRAVLTLNERLDEMAEALAISVRSQWEAEEQVRRVHDPFPLPARWTNAPEPLTDHWQTIHGSPSPLLLDGHGDHIVDTFNRIPSGRLMVLGRAGAGKTILTSRFVLTLLASRPLPVPVIFSLGSWDPTVYSLRDWLTDQLITTYPVLAERDSSGATAAAQLLTTGRILPVLDGFDEISAGLRIDAINAINLGLRPGDRMLLTSRPEEYAAAVHAGDVLTAAAVVSLEDLSVDDLSAYLPLTTRKVHSGRNKWEPVLDHLRAAPDSALARVLSTPLMVALARAIFSDTDADPAELLGVTSEFDLEPRLLAGFVPAVYSRSRQVDAQDASRWLRFLAAHLSTLGTYDLAWWRLVFAIPRLVIGVAVGLASIPLIWFILGLPVLFGAWPGNSRQVLITTVLVSSLVVAATAGALMARRRSLRPFPARVRLRIKGRMDLVTGALVHGLHSWGMVAWILGWSGLALVFGVAARSISGSAMSMVIAGCAGPVLGVVLGLMGVTVRALGAPVDPTETVSPRELLATDRDSGIREGLTFGFAAATVLLLTIWILLEPAIGLSFGSVFGRWLWVFSALLMTIGIGAIWTMSVTVWGPWLIARFWLPLTGRLPWSIMGFLADAHRRGVLRQAGGVYQFRHARLQDHLASAGGYRPEHASTPQS